MILARGGPALLAVGINLLLCGCGSNAVLIASGGPSDFAWMGRISDEYGTDDPTATMPITVGEHQYTYRIWISKDGRKLMAQTASLAGAAAAGFARGLTGGLAQGDLEFEPFRLAAQTYLDQSRGPGCELQNSRKLTHIGWEWEFTCSKTRRGKRP